jgi:hypothetical protein
MRGCPTGAPKSVVEAPPEIKIELAEDKFVRMEHLENMLNEFDDLYSNEKTLLRPNLVSLNNSRER